jgi:hypothetical protein
MPARNGNATLRSGLKRKRFKPKPKVETL